MRIDRAVLNVLSNAKTEGTLLTLVGQLDRALYTRTNKVLVMSAGVQFRDNKLTTDFRNLVERRGGIIEDLPEGAFKTSGTMVNTVIVTIPGAA